MSTALTLSRSQPQSRPALLPSIREAAGLILATDQPKCSEMAPEVLQASIVPLITGVAFLLGHRNSLTESADLKMLSKALATVIKRRFSGLKMAEISAAWQRGASGEYKQRPDEVLMPSLPALTQWLERYQQTTRAEALKALQLEQSRSELSLPPANLEAGYPGQVAELAADVLSRGGYPERLDTGGILYGWLKKIGAFRGFKTAEQYQAIKTKEAIRMAKRAPKSQPDAKNIRSLADHLRSGALPAGHALANTLLTNCQKIVLREWIRYKLSALSPEQLQAELIQRAELAAHLEHSQAA